MDRRNFLRFGLAAAATAGLPLSAQAASKGLSIEGAIRKSYCNAREVVKAVPEKNRSEGNQYLFAFEVIKDLKGNALRWVDLLIRFQVGPESRLRFEVPEPKIDRWAEAIKAVIGATEGAVGLELVVGEDRYQVDPHQLTCTPIN